MIKKVVFLFFLLCTCGIISCDDELDLNTFEGSASQYVGSNYKLTDVTWSGTPVDLNNDGISRWDLLDGELALMEGYDSQRHSGVVKIHPQKEGHKSRPSLDFVVGIPWPIYSKVNDQWKATGMLYLYIYPEMVFYGNNHWGAKTYEVHNYMNDFFVGGIEEIIVTDLKPDGFEIRVLCSLINSKNEPEKNYLHYHFKR